MEPSDSPGSEPGESLGYLLFASHFVEEKLSS
jgi:hypothetical protein